MAPSAWRVVSLVSALESKCKSCYHDAKVKTPSFSPSHKLEVAACSNQILGYPVVIPKINADGTADMTGESAGRTLASQHLTRAMIFTPIGAALSGLATLVAGITWATHSKHGMLVVSLLQ